MRQSTVETSVFGVEFVAMKKGIDALRSLIYVLSMMGILIFCPLNIYGGNVSVVCNTSRPESVLRKKSNSVFWNIAHLL